MANRVRIEELQGFLGEEVVIQGWLYDKTEKGKLVFLQVRDGSGIVQAVLFKPSLPEDVFDAARQLTQESVRDCHRKSKGRWARPGCAGWV